MMHGIAFSSASFRTILSPIPLAPPVTIITLFCKFKFMWSCLFITQYSFKTYSEILCVGLGNPGLKDEKFACIILQPKPVSICNMDYLISSVNISGVVSILAFTNNVAVDDDL